MKFTIKKIIRKEVDTKFGKKWKLSVLTDRDEWVSSFANKYTHEWREGSVVDVPTNETTGANGKTYINCVWPKENSFGPAPVADKRMDEVLQKLDHITKLLTDLHVDHWEEKPKGEMGHVNEDVPFDPSEGEPVEEF